MIGDCAVVVIAQFWTTRLAKYNRQRHLLILTRHELNLDSDIPG